MTFSGVRPRAQARSKAGLIGGIRFGKAGRSSRHCPMALILALMLLTPLARAATPACDCDARATAPVPGIESLLETPPDLLRGKRVGLITNPTGVDHRLRSSIDLLAAHPQLRLVALFGPEHGVRGDVQAGEKVGATLDAGTGLPVHSLYGEHREPTAEMLQGIDVLLFDIQDVGTRFYTYPYTLAGAMRAARRAGIPVVVLDRPNPIGGTRVEGPVLDPALASFVGQYPIPVRHGMTLGELARLFNEEFGIGAQLHVIPVQGWRRDAAEPGRTLPWVPPSPNMPTPETALVYPGTALFEGTNVSEGRGTTRPFETIGAPFIQAEALAARMNALDLPGVRFRPVWFTPTFSKHAGDLCGGVQVHVMDREAFLPFRTGLALLKTVHDLYPQAFRFEPGDPPFFDHLVGNDWIRPAIQAGESLEQIEARWQPALRRFEQVRDRYLLY